MVVKTNGEQTNRHRKNIVELISPSKAKAPNSSRPSRRGSASPRSATGRRRSGRYEVDESNPFFSFDPNTCIACARVRRARRDPGDVRDLDARPRLRGRASSPANDVGFAASNCVSSAARASRSARPALNEKAVAEFGKPEYDVAGPTCALRRRMQLRRRRQPRAGSVTMRPVEMSLVNWGHACVKGRLGWDYIYAKERLRTPMDAEGRRLVADLLGRRDQDDRGQVLGIRAQHGPGLRWRGSAPRAGRTKRTT